MKLWLVVALQMVVIVGIMGAGTEKKAGLEGTFQRDYEELMNIYKNIPNMSQEEIIAAYEKVSGALEKLDTLSKRVNAVPVRKEN